ncbi:MAG: hypothetical protein K2X98_04585 [Alphaproteobacteria bacterium]|nr:hypothetical protein [Alphaproteobacteria bacterium]
MVYFFLILMFAMSSVCSEEHGGGGEEKPPSDKKHESGGEGGGGHGGGGDAPGENGPYLGIGPLTISIIKHDEIKGYIRIKINLFAEKKEDFEYVKAIAPRLQSEFIIQLSNILSQFWITGTVEPRLDNIKNILQLITNKVLGNDKVKAVLIDSYFFAKPPENGYKPLG